MAGVVTRNPVWRAPDGTGYNDYPVGWREINEGEFAQSQFHSHTPEAIEFRQMYKLDENGHLHSDWLIDTNLFWYGDGTGIAMVADYYGKKVSYFRFGCDHEYRELTQDEARSMGEHHFGMCYHVYVCDVCGNVLHTDSSG